jgi:hypothetical protein
MAMSEVHDDFEEPSFALEGTDEGMETNSNVEEIETNPKLSISKKAAKKRDARRRIEDYLEMKRMKEVMEDFENRDIQLDSLNWFEEGANNDIYVGKK